MSIIKYCTNCGKEINKELNKGCTKGFCNNKCYQEYRQKQKRVFIKKCPVCGKEFIPIHYHNKIRFCSQNCYNKWKKEETIKNRKKYYCTNCGKELEYCYRYKNSKHYFCCRKCQSAWMIKRNKEKHYKNCVICGDLIEPTYMPHSAHWYAPDTCSEECRLKLYERTCMEKYGVVNVSQSEEIKQKKRDTMEKNGTSTLANFKTKNYATCDGTMVRSTDEVYIYNKFYKLGIKVEYEHYDDRYPYPCDFYLPDRDLFIEYQGFISHGNLDGKVYGPYDPKNEEHRELLRFLKESNYSMYESILNTWTLKDPEKREVVKKNKLNWVEFFTLEEFDKWFTSNFIFRIDLL